MSSHTQATATAVQTAIVVDVPIERAFRVFTEDFDRIKPREHNMLGVDIAETVFEPRAGGRVFDRGVDGSEFHWARILVFEPPDRVVFSWDISPQWQIEPDLANTSEVEVRFITEGPERTRVELEHRHLDRHGEGWTSMRDAVDGGGGWPLYLARYAELIRSQGWPNLSPAQTSPAPVRSGGPRSPRRHDRRSPAAPRRSVAAPGAGRRS